MEIKDKIFLNLEGTTFQKKVWQELLKIPKGETRSYKEIANAIGNPKAARAVANACGKNPYPIKIPCHRAIRSDGSIGGYSGTGGSTTKLKLLIEEKKLVSFFSFIFFQSFRVFFFRKFMPTDTFARWTSSAATIHISSPN